MPESFEEFKTAIFLSLGDKVRERLNQEREYISNSLLRGEMAQSETAESQSNADGN